MTLYLQVAVGAACYLLDTEHVVEIRNPGEFDGAAGQAADAMPRVDLRDLFDAPAGTPGPAILHAQTEGRVAALIVDRVDGLVAVEDGEFCPLPPIGPLGAVLDAVTTRLAEERPMLRLRGERALAAKAAAG